MAIRFLDEQPQAKSTIRFVDEPTTSTATLPINQGRLVDATEFALEGATFGFAPKITSALAAGALAPFMEETFPQLYEEAISRTEAGKKAYEQEFPKSAMFSRILGAIPAGAAIAGTAPAAALGSLAGRFGTAGKIGAGALAGEAAQRTYEAGMAPTGKELEVLGREGISMGGVLGGAIPAVGATIGGLKKAFTPTIRESAKPIIDLAKKYNVPLGIDDLTDSDFYKYLISEGRNLPFAKAGAGAQEQLKSFTKAIARSVGLDDVDNLSPANMDKAFTNAGTKFDALTKGKEFNVTNQAYDALAELDEAVKSGTYGAEGEKLFNKYFNDFVYAVKNEKMSGDTLASLRNKYARISRAGVNPEAKTLAKDFENVLVDIIGEDAPEALRNAKYQYKNLIAIEPLAQKVQVDGYISPALLTNRVASTYKRNFTRGKAGELGELAMLGQAIKQTIPQSGSPSRTAARAVLGQAPLDLGMLAGGAVSPLIPAAYFGAKLGGIGLNRALQSRNVNPALIGRLAGGTNLPAMYTPRTAIGQGAQAGTILGTLQGE